VSLKNFVHGTSSPDLFGASISQADQAKVWKAVDRISARFGDEAIFLAGSAQARGKRPAATPAKTLDIPYLGIVR
jgi:hypothetical protein